jgi:hypothetical protein
VVLVVVAHQAPEVWVRQVKGLLVDLELKVMAVAVVVVLVQLV